MIKKPSFLLLFLLISFGSVSAVLFTPALPQISQFFQVSDSSTQLTVTLFLVGYAMGQLIYGPLANGYGRKKALLMGIGLEIIASMLCVTTRFLPWFWLLVFARFLMALGASVGLKMTFTLVADCYDTVEGNKIISHLMMAFAITPGLGIALGGVLTDHFGWASCFSALGLYGILLFLLAYNMQETLAMPDKNALEIRTIVKKYGHTVKNLPLVCGATLMGCGTAFVYVFASLAPFIAMNHFYLSPMEYGNWNLIPPIGIILGSQLAAKATQKFPPLKAITLGLSIIISSVIVMLLAFLHQMHQAYILFFPLSMIYVGISFIFGNASALAMHATEDKSSASAMMNFINMGIATVSVLLLSLLNTTAPLGLPIVFLILSLFAIGAMQILRQNTAKEKRSVR